MTAKKKTDVKRADLVALMITDTALTNALVAAQYSDSRVSAGGAAIEATSVADALSLSIKSVQSGDMSGIEAMLVAQATALQNMFSQLVVRAATKGTVEALNIMGGLGLRAQAQSRATIQTLIDLKYPRATVFAKNANVANGGPQQVNMTATGVAPTQAPAPEAVVPNELLPNEVSNVVVAGTSGQTGRSNKELETVGIVHGAKNPKGQSCGRA